MRIKHRESPFFIPCNIRRRCSLSIAIWSLVAFILVFHLHSVIHQNESKQAQLQLTRLSITRDLEKIEEEDFHLPPQRKRNPRAVHRTGHRKPRTAVEEFLDESSELRSFFFPDNRRVVDPRVESNDSMYYYPSRQWLDTDGKPIQAHGGGVLYVESKKTYYWYGENKDGSTYQAHEKGTSWASKMTNSKQNVSAMQILYDVQFLLVELITVAQVIYTKRSSLSGCFTVNAHPAFFLDAFDQNIIGVSCYSSADLWTWKNEGVVLPGEEIEVSHDLYKLNVLERPKVIYNEKTSQYVMWMHIDDSNYTRASVGVAISDSPTGPFKYLYSAQPQGCESRDMTIFKDDDMKAYLIYSSDDNSELLHISPLTDDYRNVTAAMRRILVSQHREAPAVFKHQGTYYMITSGCTGWAPNKALAHAADSIMGPWETMGNPCVGGNMILKMTTFFSQSTFVLPLRGLPGSFIFMVDRWNYAELGDSRYVWLPLTVDGSSDETSEYNFGFRTWSEVSIYWHRRWKLPVEWRSISA